MRGESRQTKLSLAPRTSHLAPHPAFSLVELVISLAILSVGLVGAMRVFPVGLRASKQDEFVTRAILLAERNIESLKLKSWDELALGEATSAEGPFEVTVSVDQPDGVGLVDPSRLKRLLLKVGWPQRGRMRSLTLGTYLRRPTP